MSPVHVVIGARGFGLPCARRLGQGGSLLLADRDPEILAFAAQLLADAGCSPATHLVDVADRNSVRELAARAHASGELKAVVSTAGLSPHMAAPEQVFAVNMLGAIHVLEEFEPLAGSGSVAVMLASNAGYLAPVDEEYERVLALAPAEEQLEHFRKQEGADNGLGAYWLSKRGVQLRVESAALAWGRKGGRTLSVSPGIMSTPMTAFERNNGSLIDEAVANVPVGRIGMAEEIASVVDWATSPQASFVSGADLLVDGGMTAALKWSEFETTDPLKGS